MPKFVTRSEQTAIPESPEALFRSLRPTDGLVRHLWAHQADILRDYQRIADDHKDIALELPTGGGKTLVGLLVADYRRKARGQRVAYLCPTIQLARQAASKAAGYGIKAVELTGRQVDYDRVDFTAYTRAQAIAVTTYHGVFNSNPRIDAAQTLVLDDAHAAEAAVADLWSVTAKREEGTLYDAVLAAVIDTLPEAFAERMREHDIEPWRRREVELAPPLEVARRADVLRGVIVTHAVGHNSYAGAMISGSLSECLVYVSWSEILIRPLIAPTAHHIPFANADQRVYMSATLGFGGELERSFGVSKIHRLPVPPGWDEHGSGRRFFLFPDASRPENEVASFIAEAIRAARRVLVLAPSNAELDHFHSTSLPDEVAVLRASDVEDGFESFTGRESGALLLANRYDGIDLPDESCRLIVLTGLPTATHLQERFLYEKLKARRVLTERIRTRLVQGAGRCTRNPQDYAAVIGSSDQLVDFCASDENVRPMHPELQAEIAFGLDNSEDPDTDMLELLRSFLAQDSDWSEADAHVRARSADVRREPPPNATELAHAADREVQASHAAWRGDLGTAVSLAQEVADRLGGAEELRPYRGLWFYLGASWAVRRADQTGSPEHAALAAALQDETAACTSVLAWVPRMDASSPTRSTGVDYEERAANAAETLRRMGIRGMAFERKLLEAEGRVESDDPTLFELGLQDLGTLLGFEAVRPPGQAAPDGVWREADLLWLVFEAKTGELPQNPVSVADVRQTASHHDWVRNQLHWNNPRQSLTMLVTPKAAIDPNAAAIAGEVRLTSPRVLRDIAARTMAVHREIRARARGLSHEQMAGAFTQEFNRRRLHSPALLAQLGPRRIAAG